MATKEKTGIPEGKIREYYANHFKPLEFAKLVGVTDFDRREIATLDYPGTRKDFRRNKRFDSFKDFVEYLPRASPAPYKLYFGAVYKARWKGNPDAWRESISGLPWEHNSLHFDIDVNDSDLMRRGGICDCAKSEKKEKRKKICPDCFHLVKEASIFLMDTLEEDFGIEKKDAVIFFSGSRGVHVHYPSETSFGSTENADKFTRLNLVDYMSAVKEMEVDDTKIIDGKKVESVKLVARVADEIEALTLKRRIDRLVYKWFFTRSPEKTIKKSKVTPLALKLIREMFARGKAMDEIMVAIVERDLMSKQRIARMRDAVMTYRYPRYDATPTYDVRKVMKVPRSIDASTGYIVSRVDNLEGFELSDVDHVRNYVTVD